MSMELPSVLTACKLLQVLPNGVGGFVMSLDFLHGMVSREFVPKFGYPPWFPTCIGLFKLSQLTMNWVAGGAYTPFAQGLMAFQLGGVVYTHRVAEAKACGKPGAIGAAVVFSAVTATAQVQHGALGVLATIGLHAVLGALGFATGHFLSSLGRKDAGVRGGKASRDS